MYIQCSFYIEDVGCYLRLKIEVGVSGLNESNDQLDALKPTPSNLKKRFLPRRALGCLFHLFLIVFSFLHGSVLVIFMLSS